MAIPTFALPKWKTTLAKVLGELMAIGRRRKGNGASLRWAVCEGPTPGVMGGLT